MAKVYREYLISYYRFYFHLSFMCNKLFVFAISGLSFSTNFAPFVFILAPCLLIVLSPLFVKLMLPVTSNNDM